MGVSSNLEVLQLTETQAQKALAVNVATQALELALSASLSLITTSATTIGDNVEIPFDDTLDLSSRNALRQIRLTLLAGATANFNVIHPANPHIFACKNLTSVVATVTTAGGTGVDLLPNAEALLYCDGSDIVSLVATDNRVSASFEGIPANSEVLHRELVHRNAKLPANLIGAAGAVGDNPTASTVLSIQDDGVTVGTATIDTGGVFTFASTAGATITVAAGSVLTIINQATADLTAGDFALSIPLVYE